VVRELLATGLTDKIVVCDNASTDTTATAAQNAGAIVVSEAEKGYGAACLRAMAELTEVDCTVFVDGDHSVCATELPALLDAWLAGAQLVIGSRTLGKMAQGALTPHQRWGNRLASFLLTTLWSTTVTDLGPYRVIDTSTLQALKMQERTYGWTVEMQAKALAAGLTIAEVPVTSLRRIGVSKVSGTWRGSLGAAVGILSTIAKIGVPSLFTRKKPLPIEP